MSRVLIFGGGGLLGTAISEILLGAGNEVGIFDNFSGCDRMRLTKGCSITSSDVASASSVEYAVEKNFKPDYIVVCISHSFRKGHIYNYGDEVATILNAAINVGRALNPKIKGVFYCSSGDVYGAPESKLPLSETRKITHPNSHAGSAYLRGEELISYRCKELGIPLTIIRVFDLFGPRYVWFPTTGTISFLIEAFLLREQIAVTRGDRRRDFLHSKDAAEAITALMTIEHKGTEIYNLGSGTGIRLKDFCKKLSEYLPVEYLPIYLPDKNIRTYNSTADISKIKEVTGWAPTRGLIETLPEQIDIVKSELSKSKDRTYQLMLSRGLIK